MQATSPAAAGTQSLLGGEKQVGLSVLLKDTEEQIVTQPCRSNQLSFFSGHGFKFAPVVGKILCDMATGSPPKYDLSHFKISRFLKPKAKL